MLQLPLNTNKIDNSVDTSIQHNSILDAMISESTTFVFLFLCATTLTPFLGVDVVGAVATSEVNE